MLQPIPKRLRTAIEHLEDLQEVAVLPFTSYKVQTTLTHLRGIEQDIKKAFSGLQEAK